MHDPLRNVLWPAFEKEEVRIRYFAHRRGLKSRERIAKAGHDTGELEPDALINSVFDRLVQKKVEWDPAETSIFLFFCRQIHNRVRLFERRATITQLRIVNATGSLDDGNRGGLAKDEVSADRIGPSAEEAVTVALYELNQADLMAYVAAHSPELVGLAELLYAGYSHKEQVQRLGRSHATVRRWRNQLVALIYQYRDVADAPPERRPSHRGGSQERP